MNIIETLLMALTKDFRIVGSIDNLSFSHSERYLFITLSSKKNEDFSFSTFTMSNYIGSEHILTFTFKTEDIINFIFNFDDSNHYNHHQLQHYFENNLINQKDSSYFKDIADTFFITLKQARYPKSLEDILCLLEKKLFEGNINVNVNAENHHIEGAKKTIKI